MRDVHTVVSLFLLGCSGGTTAPGGATTPAPNAIGNPIPIDAPVVASDPPGVKLATCVPDLATKEHATDSVVITSIRATLCYDDTPRTCWRAELDARRFEPIEVSPKITTPPDRRFDTASLDGETIHACMRPGAECLPIASPIKKLPAETPVSNNPDRSILAITVMPKSVKLFETATGKARGVIKSWKTTQPNGLQDAALFPTNDRVIVWSSVTPISLAGKLFDLDGKFLANIGSNDFSQNKLDSWPIDATHWAFKAIDSDSLVVVDVTTGTQVTYHLGDDHPLAFVAGTDTRIDAVFDGAPVVVTIDRASGTVSRFSPRACP